MAQEIYNFHAHYFGHENLIRVREVANPSIEGVIVAVPVKGISFEHAPGIRDELDEVIAAENIVIVRWDIGHVDPPGPLDYLLKRVRIIR